MADELGSLFPTDGGLTTPLVGTDKPDYRPGETATITASGFAPGEMIRFDIQDSPDRPGSDGDVDVYEPIFAIADETGSVTVQWTVPATDSEGGPYPDALNATLNLTATGSAGQVATATFTDANPPPVQLFYIPEPESQLLLALQTIADINNNGSTPWQGDRQA